MPASVIVWDIETVPDLRGFAAANGLIGKLDDEVRAEMGEKFPKLIYHSIVCIGALVAQRQEEQWSISALGAPHIGERSEKEIISAFLKRIADLAPQLVTFNGASFDLPVLRCRAMVCRVAAPGLGPRPYFSRVHRRGDRPVRRAVLLQPPKQTFATRVVPCHGVTGEARRHRRGGRREVLS
jgi:predicted PolB exonuclease-like 3'-5' exonuclease